MKHARVTLDPGSCERGHPVFERFANAQCVDRARTLQWTPAGDVLGFVHHAEGDADAFERVLADSPAVRGYDLERAGGRGFYVYVTDATTGSVRDLFVPLDGDFVVVPPVVHRGDGSATLSLFGPDRDVQAAVGDAPDSASLRVETVGGPATTSLVVEARLTDRQREALSAATALGYYDVPREATHEDVADALGCAPSTAAEHLRKAESHILQSVGGG